MYKHLEPPCSSPDNKNRSVALASPRARPGKIIRTVIHVAYGQLVLPGGVWRASCIHRNFFDRTYSHVHFVPSWARGYRA